MDALNPAALRRLLLRLDSEPDAPPLVRRDAMRWLAMASLGLLGATPASDPEGLSRLRSLLSSAKTSFCPEESEYRWIRSGGSFGAERTDFASCDPEAFAAWVLARRAGPPEFLTPHPDFLAAPDGLLLPRSDSRCGEWASALLRTLESLRLEAAAPSPVADLPRKPRAL